MKDHYKYCIAILLLAFSLNIQAQTLPEAFLKKYNSAKTDREKGEAVVDFAGYNNDSIKGNSLLLLSYFNKNEDQVGSDYTRMIINMLQNNTGDFANTLKASFEALKRFENSKDEYGKMWAYAAIANSYAVSKNYDKAIFYYKKQSVASKLLNDSVRYINTINNIAYTYVLANMPDSGIVYAQQAVDLSYAYRYRKFLPYAMSTLGENYMAKREYKKALPIIRESYFYFKNDAFATAGIINDLIECYAALNSEDSLFHYARLAIAISKENTFNNELLRTYESLYKFFDKTNKQDSSNKYFRSAIAIRDSLYNIEKIKLIQNETFNQQLREQEEAERQLAFENRVKLYSLLAALLVFLIIAVILFHNNRQKQKANKLLQQQKHDIENQRDEIRQVLEELKATQAQLIQSEKMASLGELTAGIAHEIQNPLNFVNNFSEVNNELFDELKDERQKAEGERNEEAEDEIINDIKQNLEKINYHGKRADAIVKGMLLHSRQTKGIKEPTDINAMCDEYLRLSYHGLRAKDKSFNADFKTDFDDSIGKIALVRQDIGRALLNLFNNAFYAVKEKKKLIANGYRPEVKVSTRRLNDVIEISISDNGNGMPQQTIDKIFHPFFTTKPTGEGTGLGLSLTYDIITKEHNGTIKVESKEGEGSVFVVQVAIG